MLGLIPLVRSSFESPCFVRPHLARQLQKRCLDVLLLRLSSLTLGGISGRDGLGGILERLQVGERMGIVWLKHPLLVPLIPSRDEEKVLVDAPGRMMTHVAERLLQCKLELFRRSTVARAAASHTVVEARCGSPVLWPGGNEILVLPGCRTSTTLTNCHEVEAGVKEARHELRATSPAHSPQEVDPIEAILLGQLVPVVHHRAQLVADLLRKIDCENRLVVNLLVETLLEVWQ
mmetsp:Transcript_18950/g.35514  ORF Transcript_18950/g.35514 Transcript_18950/m.35514 type:complete len:233 (-) Transcript_18950:1415-2113(-)